MNLSLAHKSSTSSGISIFLRLVRKRRVPFLIMLMLVVAPMAVADSTSSLGSLGAYQSAQVGTEIGDIPDNTVVGYNFYLGTISGATSEYGSSGTWTAQSAIANGNDPIVFASLSQGGSWNRNTPVSWYNAAYISYQFELSGPSGTVPMLCICDGSANVSGGSAVYSPSATSSVAISYFNGYNTTSVAGSNANATFENPDATFTLSPNLGSLPANTPITVTIIAIIDTDDTGQGGNAQVDPIFYINPSFANASEYTLEFSDGISGGGPPPSVPEPGTSALLLVGLGFISFMISSLRAKQH